ncbi:MAG: argininosuccinate lyase [Candidatus Bathyarchaeia archaeon]
MSKLLRGGRISKAEDGVIKYISSIKSDHRIFEAVIKINQAHILMLSERGIISPRDASIILKAISDIDPTASLPSDIEDVHMYIEETVIAKCGLNIGGNIHIAKSRNDQVATAIRMELREELLNVISHVVSLQEALLALSARNVNTLFVGYTHMQPAQPVTFAHYLLSQFDTLNRDIQRLEEAYTRVNMCPMGAGAIATTTFPISRERIAELLAFDGVVENSIDAVSGRDFILEVMAALTILAVNISRFVEDLIIFGSFDVNLIELPEDFCSTSSIMPQKKNPDVLEVIRARMGDIIGNFMASITTIKALPTGYNLDFQEVTPKLWECIDIIKEALDMLSKLITKVEVREEKLARPELSFLAATELANMLTRNYHIPFRASHKIVGALVRELISKGMTLRDANAEMLGKISATFGFEIKLKDEDLQAALNLSNIVNLHNVTGGPSPAEVRRMLKTREEILNHVRSRVFERRSKIKKSIEKLESAVKSLIGSAGSHTNR